MSDQTENIDIKALTIQRERFMQAFQDQMDTAWKAVLCLPESNPMRQPALDAIQEAWWTNQGLLAVIQDGEAALAGMQAALELTQQQRNDVLTEYEGLMQAMESGWFTEHPALEQLAENIANNYAEAFWESLPYDMAAVLGDRWSHMDADMLHTLITTNLELFDDDGMNFGVTREQAQLFRQGMWMMLQQLNEANHGQ